ncbi:MAG: histone deacetylase [Betaproteobacteria bacterium]|nr:histone deacetylase [Betaproteobacteria bacterium]
MNGMPSTNSSPLKSRSPNACVPVFYTERQVAEPQRASPSASKPRRVMQRWREKHFPIDVREPQPATVEDLARAHDRKYVGDILACRESNGFFNKSASVAQSLPWTNGSMLSAARHVVGSRGIACAPCSGFHHAHWDTPGGFCTFNGLMVTALALRAEGLATQVGILDCDQHFGDGTVEIMERVNARGWIRHLTAGRDYPRVATRFLGALPGLVKSFAGCDVLLYQAGADPHIEDPLGGFLDDEQLAQRDAIVFTTARELGIPVAWNLAGGYQEPLDKVLNIHDRTMEACVADSLHRTDL